ncbi:hypothetical protein ACLOJK_040462 [Asimina triloba]
MDSKNRGNDKQFGPATATDARGIGVASFSGQLVAMEGTNSGFDHIIFVFEKMPEGVTDTKGKDFASLAGKFVDKEGSNSALITSFRVFEKTPEGLAIEGSNFGTNHIFWVFEKMAKKGITEADVALEDIWASTRHWVWDPGGSTEVALEDI